MDCGPKTLKVTVPLGLAPDERTELIEEAGIVEPDTAVAGPAAVTVGLALEIDSVCDTEVRDPEDAVIFGLPTFVSP